MNLDGQAPSEWDVLTTGTPSQREALAANPELEADVYGEMIRSWKGRAAAIGRQDDKKRYRREAPARKVGTAAFLDVLRGLGHNPRVGIAHSDSVVADYPDAFSYFEYRELADGIWEVAELAPRQAEWAEALVPLVERVAEPCAEERGRALVAKWAGSPYDTLREAIAARTLPVDLALLESDDNALRQAFYRRFDPLTDPALLDLDWKAWMERDPQCWIWMIDNPNIWRSPKARERLIWLAEDPFDRMQISHARERQKAEHPEWFAEQEAESSADFSVLREKHEAERRGIAAVRSIAGDMGHAAMEGKAIVEQEIELDCRTRPYHLDEASRDMLIAHGRQDAASAFIMTDRILSTIRSLPAVLNFLLGLLVIIAILLGIVLWRSW